ncbi:MAG: acyltransferase [Planctomycetota bacterium]
MEGARPLDQGGGESAGAGGHLPVLDGLRGLAVLLVVLVHTREFEPTTWVGRGLDAVMRSGWMGVDLFFVLSGFLITGILLRAKTAAPRGDAGKARHRWEGYLKPFLMRRVLRVLPLYYAVLVVVFWVIPMLPMEGASVYAGLAEHQGWFWLHLSNVHFALHGLTGDPTDVMWSLAVEEQFYLLWPMVVWWVPARWLGRVCAGLVVTAVVLRVVALGTGVVGGVGVYVLPFMRMDALAFGAWLAVWRLRGGRVSGWWAGVGVVGSLVGLVVLGLLRGGLYFLDPWVQGVGFVLLGVLFVSVMGVATARDGRRTWVHVLVDRRWLRVLGKYSYAIYLLHQLVKSVLWNLGLSSSVVPEVWGSPLPGQVVWTGLVLGATLGLAWVSWHVLEAPCLRLKRRYPYAEAGGGRGDAADQPRRAVGPAG